MKTESIIVKEKKYKIYRTKRGIHKKDVFLYINGIEGTFEKWNFHGKDRIECITSVTNLNAITFDFLDKNDVEFVDGTLSVRQHVMILESVIEWIRDFNPKSINIVCESFGSCSFLMSKYAKYFEHHIFLVPVMASMINNVWKNRLSQPDYVELKNVFFEFPANSHVLTAGKDLKLIKSEQIEVIKQSKDIIHIEIPDVNHGFNGPDRYIFDLKFTKALKDIADVIRLNGGKNL